MLPYRLDDSLVWNTGASTMAVYTCYIFYVRQFANPRWVRTTRGPPRRLVRIEDLERLGESNPEIMANNASHRGTRNPIYDGDNEE